MCVLPHVLRLFSGSNSEETLWFNIGNSDTFERNLENAQLEFNIKPQNPVIYKNKIEAGHIILALPTILTIAIILYFARQSAEMFGGKEEQAR